MIEIKLTEDQLAIIKVVVSNYASELDSQIENLIDDSIRKYAKNRLANCNIIVKVIDDTLLKRNLIS